MLMFPPSFQLGVVWLSTKRLSDCGRAPGVASRQLVRIFDQRGSELGLSTKQRRQAAMPIRKAAHVHDRLREGAHCCPDELQRSAAVRLRDKPNTGGKDNGEFI